MISENLTPEDIEELDIEELKKDVFIGRRKELENLKTIIGKKDFNSVLLVWDIWVGKTALVNKFISDNPQYVFKSFKDLKKTIEEARQEWRIDLESIFEEYSKDDVILVLDHILNNEILESFEMFEIIKNRNIKKIVVLTYWKLSKIVLEEEDLFSWFEKLELFPIVANEEIKKELSWYLLNLIARYEINLSETVLDLIISLSQQYLSSQYMPFKVKNVIDLISSYKWKGAEGAVITKEDVIQYFGKLYGNAITFRWDENNEEETNMLLNLEEILAKNIIGHKEALRSVSNAVRIAKVGLMSKDKPLSSFMFSWPTGTGKTEVCKALALALYWDKDAMIRIDCSEYSTKESIYKLIGSPPGTFWFEKGWLLTNAVAKNPNCIVLFDELEKSLGKSWNGSDLVDNLLQVLDEWFLTDSSWKRVSFRNTIIVMTTNVGSTVFQDIQRFGHRYTDERQKRQAIEEEFAKTFRPEFINRIDEVIIFGSLSPDEIKQIVELKLSWFQKLVKNQHWIDIDYDKSLIDFISQEWFDPKNGGRPVNRAIKNILAPELATKILTKQIVKWDSILIKYLSSWQVVFDYLK